MLHANELAKQVCEMTDRKHRCLMRVRITCATVMFAACSKDNTDYGVLQAESEDLRAELRDTRQSEEVQAGGEQSGDNPFADRSPLDHFSYIEGRPFQYQ